MSALDMLASVFGESIARQWYARGADPYAWLEVDDWLAMSYFGPYAYRVLVDGRIVDQGTTGNPIRFCQDIGVDDVRLSEHLRTGEPGVLFVHVSGSCPFDAAAWNWIVQFETLGG